MIISISCILLMEWFSVPKKVFSAKDSVPYMHTHSNKIPVQHSLRSEYCASVR